MSIFLHQYCGSRAGGRILQWKLILFLLGNAAGAAPLTFLDQPDHRFSRTAPAVWQQKLANGNRIEGQLNGGQNHVYSLELPAGQFVRLEVDQKGIDLQTRVFDPNGNLLVHSNMAPNDRVYGLDPAYFLTRTTGIHRIEISAVTATAATGTYSLKIGKWVAAGPSEISFLEIWQKIRQMEADGGQSIKPDQQLEVYRAALPVVAACGETWMEGGIHLAIANLNVTQGDNAEAVVEFQKAIARFLAVDDRECATYGRNSLASALHTLGDYPSAIHLFDQVAAHGRETRQPLWEVYALMNQAAVFEVQRNTYRMHEATFRALKLMQQEQDLATLGILSHRFGSMLMNWGDPELGLEYLKQAVVTIKKTGQLSLEAKMLNELAQHQAKFGKFAEAIENNRRATAILEQLGDQSSRADSLTVAGLIYRQQGKREPALAAYQQALDWAQAKGNDTLTVGVLMNLGFVHLTFSEDEAAEIRFRAALQLAQKTGNKHQEASIQQYLAGFHLKRGEADSCRKLLLQVLDLRRQLNQPELEADVLWDLARSERTLNHLTASQGFIREAIERFEQARDTLAGSEEKSTFFFRAQSYYRFYTDLLMELHQREPDQGFAARAFEIMERARAGGMQQKLAEAQTQIRRSAPPSLLEQERELSRKISSLSERLALLGPGEADAAESLKAELNRLSLNLALVRNQIRAAQVPSEVIKKPVFLTISEIQKQLDPKTALVSFALGETGSYGWLVTARGIDSFRLPPRNMLENAAQEVIDRASLHLAGSEGETEQAARKLGTLLFGPMAGKLGAERLVIIPDGKLYLVPFAGLLVEAEGKNRPSSSSRTGKTKSPAFPLIDRHELVLLPAASMLAAWAPAGPEPGALPKEITVFSDPVFSAALLGQKALPAAPGEEPLTFYQDRFRSANGPFAPLPGSREQGRVIAGLARQSGWVCHLKEGLEANKDNLETGEVARSRILHFATHGYFENRHPELTGLVLSLVDQRGNARDGFLLTPEIFNLTYPKAELVVLSACDTSQGKGLGIEGVVGMVQAFMHSGSPRVLASLWKVGDRSTAELMKLFYRHLLVGKLSPAQALRRAQLDLRKNPRFRAMRYWSGFVMHGKW